MYGQENVLRELCKTEKTSNPCTSTSVTKARCILYGLPGRFWDGARMCAYTEETNAYLCIKEIEDT